MKGENLIVGLICTVFASTAIVLVGYLWVIPTFFAGCKTQILLWLGVGLGAVVSGLLGYRYCEARVSVLLQFGISVCLALLAGIIVLWGAMLVIVNIRGV